MVRVLIIGAGAVGKVVAHKCAQMQDVFDSIVLASRTLGRCQEIAGSVLEASGCEIATAEVDADHAGQLHELIQSVRPFLVINVALPYHDLHIMDACLEGGAHYLDTANYEPRDTARFEYHWQWAYRQRFERAGLTAVLGCGFDPGVTNVFTAHLAEHYFDEIHQLDIIDVNGGDHGLPFATNFNAEINLREVAADCRHWENGKFILSEAMSCKASFTCPEGVGTYDIYRMYHEELESLTLHYPSLRRAQFWMSFSEDYLTHLRVLKNVGLTGLEPVTFEDRQVVPLQFLANLLPEPGELGKDVLGKTCIGVVLQGMAEGEPKTLFCYQICDHQQTYRELGSQAVPYTCGVPAAIGAKLVAQGDWRRAGVFNVEQFPPDPFMQDLNHFGLPWKLVELEEFSLGETVPT